MSSEIDLRTLARELALQFLYQTESERLLHFSESHFLSFVQNQSVVAGLVPRVRDLTRGTLESIDDIDTRIGALSSNWKVSRMPVVDRNVIRLAVYELLKAETPPRVVLNEAIELAKKFGAENSGSFVNGLLDKLAQGLKIAL